MKKIITCEIKFKKIEKYNYIRTTKCRRMQNKKNELNFIEKKKPNKQNK